MASPNIVGRDSLLSETVLWFIFLSTCARTDCITGCLIETWQHTARIKGSPGAGLRSQARGRLAPLPSSACLLPQQPTGWSMPRSAIGSRKSHLWALKDSNEELGDSGDSGKDGGTIQESVLFFPLRWVCELAHWATQGRRGRPQGDAVWWGRARAFGEKNGKEHSISSQATNFNHVLRC